MRIVEDTANRLVLEDGPWLLGSVLVIVILFLALLAFLLGRENLWLGLGMALAAALFGVVVIAFIRKVTVIFDRQAGAVVIRTLSVFGKSETRHLLADIIGAGVQTTVNRSTSTNGSSVSSVSETHQTVLHLPGQDVPLTQDASSGDGAANAAEVINRWLRQ